MNEKEREGGVVPETPLGRRADTSEIAGAIAFLAGSDSSFGTGTELVVDGGFCLVELRTQISEPP